MEIKEIKKSMFTDDLLISFVTNKISRGSYSAITLDFFL